LRILEEKRLKEVVAIHRGVKKKMALICKEFVPVEWTTNDFIISSSGIFAGRCPSIQIILENDVQPLPAKVGKFVHLSKLFNTKFQSDVKFVVQGTKLKAHCAIVATASPVIADIIKAKSPKGGQIKVHIEDTEPEVFKQMITYLYTGVGPKADGNVLPLLVAAFNYQINPLKEECEHFLTTSLSTYNVISRLILAQKYSASKLREACLEYVYLHSHKVIALPQWKALSHEEPDLFLLATQKILSKNKQSRRKDKRTKKSGLRCTTCHQ
jgi:speckle-type POZ protein